jgi:hypothetical protein
MSTIRKEQVVGVGKEGWETASVLEEALLGVGLSGRSANIVIFSPEPPVEPTS